MTPDHDLAFSHDTRAHSNSLVRVRVLDPEQLLRQSFAELTVQPQNVLSRGGICLFLLILVNTLLNLDMGERFELQGSTPWLLGVVFRQRSIDVARMCVVPFDQV